MDPQNRNALHVNHDLKAQNNKVFADRIMSVVVLPQGATVLEVGCGGAELSWNLRERYGLECWGIEPFPMYAPGIDPARVMKGVAEAISFPDESFDLVVAKDVLEHVDDVEKALDELLRVSRRYVYIMCPNYLYPYEAHFKIPFVPLLPKRLARWYLRLFGFDHEQIAFLDHINYVTKQRFYRAIRRSLFVERVYAVLDLQLAKGFRRSVFWAPILDLIANDKVELLIVKRGVECSDVRNGGGVRE